MPRRYPILAFCSWLAVGAVTLAQSAGGFALGLRGGWFVGGLAGVCTFAFLFWVTERPLAAALRATAFGFLIRFAMLTLGLVFTARAGGSPSGFCVGFFAVYLPIQVIEMAGLLRGRRPTAVEVRP